MNAISFKGPKKEKRFSLSQGKHGTSFTRLFFVLAILGMLISIFTMSFIYSSTKESVTKNIQDSKVMTTNQIKNTFEREIQTIEKSFNAYSTTNDFYDMVQEPLGIQNFRKYREITSQLNYFSSFSLPGTIYSFISTDQQWRVDNHSLKQMSEDQLSEFKSFYIEGRDQNLYWIPDDAGIISVSLLPIFSRDKLAVGMAQIPNTSIDSLLEVTDAVTPFYIVNRNDEIIYSANTNDDEFVFTSTNIKEVRDTSNQLETGVITEFVDAKQDTSLIYTKSDYNNWLYVTYLDPIEVNNALEVTRLSLIGVTIALILISIVMSYVIAGRVVKPIEKLMSNLAIVSGQERVFKDDWAYISSRIESIVSEKESLQNIHMREMPELKKQFMFNLYRNRVVEVEFEQKTAMFDYPLHDEQIYNIMLIQIDNYSKREVQNKDVFLVGINEFVSELIPREHRLTPVVLNDELQVTLLIFDKDDLEVNKKLATEYADRIIAALDQYMNLSVSVAFSPFYQELSKSKENLDRGKDTLAYHHLFDKQAIIFFDEIELVSEISEYPEASEADLFQSIRLGEVEKVEEIAPKVVDAILESSSNPVNVQVALLRLALNLVQLSQTLNADILQEERGVELYEVVLQSHDFRELRFDFLDNIILPFAHEMSEKNEQQFQRLSEQIITIVENNFTEDITLESIGDELHYNPNYLSNIFKKETGITFSDYLTTYRFDTAKKWLRETDVTIKSISERLQYRNPQNFIRSFKKKENMTPGQYRKKHTPS